MIEVLLMDHVANIGLSLINRKSLSTTDFPICKFVIKSKYLYDKEKKLQNHLCQ